MKPATFLQSPLGAIRRGLSQLRTTPSPAAFGITALLILAAGSPSAHAQNYAEQIVHSFKGNANDGSFPGNLINVNGIIYGTTIYGGANGVGTVYSLDPTTHASKVIYSFGANGSADGNFPNSLVDVNGTLYGTTNAGGTNNHGTVFSIDETTHAEKVLYSFAATDLFGANADGNGPVSVIDVNGTLYGTAYSGGAHGQGTVFSINETTHAETTVHSFSSFGGTTDGSYLLGGLINVNGTLYGTTVSGGAYGTGTVFSINPTTHAESIIYSFNGFNGDANGPIAGLLYANGAVYGTTQYGGTTNLGAVFSVDLTTHAEKLLHSFHAALNDGDGTSPFGSLINVNGTLFGTSQTGGAFSINPDGTGYTMVYNFTPNSSDGVSPESSLVNINGILYGSTLGGGTYGGGTVYSLAPASGPPVAANDSYTAQYKTALTVAAPGVLGNDNNGGAGPLTAKLVTNVTHGTLMLSSNGSFSYTPTGAYVGTDSFTYQVASPAGTGTTATVTIMVQGTVPTARNDSSHGNCNTALVIAAPSVLANDANSDSSTMTAQLVSGTSHGTITFNSDGSFKYVPGLNYTGPDSFTYQAVNGVGHSNTATCSITVQATVPNAHTDSCTVAHNHSFDSGTHGVLVNDVNGDSSTMTVQLVTGPSHGTVTLNSDGTFTYTPSLNYTGSDSFTYQAVNDIGHGNTCPCMITVQ